MTLPACTVTRVDILADISADAAADGEHLLRYVSAELEGTSVVQVTAAPSEVVGVRHGANTAEVSVEMLPLHLPVRYGANRTVARLRLEPSGRRNQQLIAITFTNGGSARNADVQHIRLFASRGETISAIASTLDGDRVRLVLDPPLTLESGATYMLEVRADVRASRRRTLQLHVEEAADVESAVCTGKRVCIQAH